MSNAVIKILSFALAALMVLSYGVMFGVTAQNGYETVDYVVTKENSKMIAITNQDLGVNTGGKHINMASRLIEAMEDDYVVVSKAEGEKGLRQGDYGVLITFPNNFSENIFSINDPNPEIASFFYDISPVLTKSDTVEVLLKIMEMEGIVQESVSYMYLYSIMDELHSAQDTSGVILDSSNKSVLSVRGFRESDYGFYFDFSPINGENPALERPSFNQYMDEASKLLRDIEKENDTTADALHKEYTAVSDRGSTEAKNFETIGKVISGIDITSGQTELVTRAAFSDYFENIKLIATAETTARLEKMGILIDQLESDVLLNLLDTRIDRLQLRQMQLGISENEENLVVLGDSREARVEEFEDDLKELVEETYMDDFKNDLITTLGESSTQAVLGMSLSQTDIDNLCDIIMDTVPDYPAAEVTDLLDDLFIDVDKYYEKYIKKVLALQIAFDRTAMESYMVGYTDRQTSLLAREIRSFTNSLPPESEYTRTITGSFRDVTKHVSDTMGDISQQLRDSETGLKKELDDENKKADDSYREFLSMVTAYDIFSYFSQNKEKTKTYYSDLFDNSDKWNELVGELIDERDMLSNDNYGKYQEHLHTIMKEAGVSKDEAEEILNWAIEDMLVEQLLQNDNIHAAVGLFSDKLPNSRIGDLPNTGYYNYVVSPVDGIASNKNQTPAQITAQQSPKGTVNSYDTAKQVLFISSISLAVLRLTTLVVKQIAKKRKAKE